MDYTITRTAKGWSYRAWLTRERMFCKACRSETGEWVQLGGSVLMDDPDHRTWKFFGRQYRGRLAAAVRRHFRDVHPNIVIR